MAAENLLTWQDALAVIERWRQQAAIELLAGVRYDPYCNAVQDGKALIVVEDVMGASASGKVLGGLYCCPKCNQLYLEVFAIGAGGEVAAGARPLAPGVSNCPRDGQELDATSVVLGGEGNLTALFRCPKCKQVYSQFHESQFHKRAQA